MSKQTEDLIFSAVYFLLDLKDSVDSDKFYELQETLSLSDWNFSLEMENLIGEAVFIKKYQEISSEARKHPSFATTLQQIVQCIDLLGELNDALDDEGCFKKIVKALQFDNLSKSHSEVTKDLDATLANFTEGQRLIVRRLFAEKAVTDELGFSHSELLDAQKILGDEELYIDVLVLLHQSVTNNFSWEATVDSVARCINSRNPGVCELFEMFLWFHHAQKTSSDPESWYEKYCEYAFNMSDPTSDAPLNITEKLQNLGLNRFEGPAA